MCWTYTCKCWRFKCINYHTLCRFWPHSAFKLFKMRIAINAINFKKFTVKEHQQHHRSAAVGGGGFTFTLDDGPPIYFKVLIPRS